MSNNPWIIYYNGDCSKCRGALSILQAHNIDAKVINYLENPLSTEEIQAICTKLNMGIDEIIRKHEAPYLALSEIEKKDPQALLVMLAVNPIALERPIVVHGEKAIIARPPEKIHQLLT